MSSLLKRNKPTTHDKSTTIAFVTKYGKDLAAAIDDTGIFFPVAVAIQMDMFEKQGASYAPNFSSWVSDLKTKYASTNFLTTSSPEQQLTALKKGGLVLNSISHLSNLNAARDVYKFGRISSTRPNANAEQHVKRLGKQAEFNHDKLKKAGKTKENLGSQVSTIAKGEGGIKGKLETIKEGLQSAYQDVKDKVKKPEDTNQNQVVDGSKSDPAQHGGSVLGDPNFNI